MSLKVERFVSPGKGNGLRARQKMRAGELICTAEPLASCVSKKSANNVCHNCFSRCASLLRCSQCKAVRYCDTTCQRQAWPGHRRECRSLRSILPRIPSDSVRLAARIIFRLLDPSQSSKDELYSLEELESHLSDMSEEKREGLTQLGSMLQLYLQQEVPDLTQEVPDLTQEVPDLTQEVPDLTQEVASPLPTGLDSLSLLARVTCNCFTISDGELQEVGVGLYPSMSLLNHDCRPCCVVMFEGTRLHLRALRDIQPSEELTISYVETVAPSRDRQAQLQDQYHFLCTCLRCSTRDMDALMLAGEEAAWSPLRDATPRLDKLQAEGDWQSVLEECQSLLGPAGGAVARGNVYRLRVSDRALDACIALQRWDSALFYGTSSLQAYRQYYPDPHPAHAIQLMRVGKLQHFLVQLQDAQDTLRKAYDIMKVTHGDQHPLTSDLTGKLEECRAEMDRS